MPSSPPSSSLDPVVEFRPPVAGRPPLGSNVLACIGFDGSAPRESHADDDPRLICAGLPRLSAGPAYEVWSSEHRVDSGRDAGVSYARDGEVLFGSLFVPEFELEPMAAAAFKAYARIIALLERQGYPWLLRCWNFLHGINRGQSDGERYKQFCVGRYQALSQTRQFEHQLPAGTAISLHEPGLLIYFLAAKQPGQQVENPRQMPAFQYPRQYGPRSPSFSRATLWPRAGAAHLLVSGTASVIGHATRHPGEALPQLDETLENLKALLDHSATVHLRGAPWIARNLKLYLRNPSDLAAVRARAEQKLGASAPLMILQGDICRTDLMLEIEGVYSEAPSASADDNKSFSMTPAAAPGASAGDNHSVSITPAAAPLK